MKKLDGKWVIGVSGGPDSMALLDMAFQAGSDIIVAHVNYQKRDTALRDEDGVEEYCQKNNIPFFKYRVETYDKGNFQAQARKIRYTFFKKLVNMYNCNGVLIAHHLDDLLETYVMQKQRKSIPSYYGIREEVEIYGVFVKRLLLGYTKQELMDYCRKQNVSYYEDESNSESSYTRNRVRHQLIEHLNVQEKKNMVKYVQQENQKLQEKQDLAKTYYKENRPLTCEGIQSLDKLIGLNVIRIWILETCGYVKLSSKLIDQVYKYLSLKQNWTYMIRNKWQIRCEYGKLFIDEKKDKSYCYQLTKIAYMKTPYFSVKASGDTVEGILVKEDDFPLTIRNYKKGDKIKLRYGTKKVSRFLIDRKIPNKQREIWPVVVNNMGEIIFVYGIGCDIKHYGNNFNMFVVK